ncbi:MAG: ion transporter [Bacteroidota bacterium]
MRTIRERVFDILEVSITGKRDFSWYFDITLLTVIILNVLAIILESVASIYTDYVAYFRAFEYFSIVFFSVEYVLRVWSITVDANYRHPIWGRLKYIFTAMALVDLLAILPFFVEWFVAVYGASLAFKIDMRFLRMLRIFRVFRMFKIVRYVSALRIINNVLRRKREELVISLVFILFILLIVSCLMYFVEREAQPDQFSSIPATMWWGVATLTTVGYGDIYPVTTLGKFLGGVISILGIGIFALPTGILAAGCAEEIERGRRAEEIVCPHCQKSFLHEEHEH